MSNGTIINSCNESTQSKKNDVLKDPSTDFMAFEKVRESATYLMDRTRYRPKIAVICGSGLAGLAELLKDSDVFDYHDIPNFPVSTVPGHKSLMVFGMLQNIPVMLMQGRFHAYEGYPLQLCGMPVRVMKLCGIENLIVTNAAGGLRSGFNVGDIMVISDHINLPGFTGSHPLKGPNDNRFGHRFFALNHCYERAWRKLAKAVAKDMKMEHRLHEGIYVMLGGPNFETVAELRMLKTCGVDAVGMSTIPEVLVASHCGMKVFAFSLITNKCVLDEDTEKAANHEEVMQTGAERQEELSQFVTRMILGMSSGKQ